MSPEEKELYEKTIGRLLRAGCRYPEQQIIFLAQEIERYRAKIEYLETAKATEQTGPVMCLTARTYTSHHKSHQAEEIKHCAKADIAKRLAGFLVAADCISYESKIILTVPDCMEHLGTIRVVMPKTEGESEGNV